MKITALFQKQFHKHPSVASLKAHNSKHIGNGIYEVLMLMKHYKSESDLKLIVVFCQTRVTMLM